MVLSAIEVKPTASKMEKQARLHDAQISHTAYRGVAYDQGHVESKETHGTFCYRGKTYSK